MGAPEPRDDLEAFILDQIAADPDMAARFHVAELRHEADVLRQIVKDLAVNERITSGLCKFCGEIVNDRFYSGPATDFHKDTCLWRRAVEAVRPAGMS